MIQELSNPLLEEATADSIKPTVRK
jgi:hypothetical protein